LASVRELIADSIKNKKKLNRQENEQSRTWIADYFVKRSLIISCATWTLGLFFSTLPCIVYYILGPNLGWAPGGRTSCPGPEPALSTNEKDTQKMGIFIFSWLSFFVSVIIIYFTRIK
jgi:hypothetical protein